MSEGRTHQTDLALAGSAGFVLPAAVMVMFLVGLLAAVAVAVAVSTSSSTTRDEHAKAALAAAEAGLRVATYRITMLNPEGTYCVAHSEAALPTGGYCSDTTESIGNGAKFIYQTTAALSSGEKCVGLTVNTSGTDAMTQRCVTATGTAGGVSERVQARVASFSATPLFPNPGITGRQEVNLEGNAEIEGAIASNGKSLCSA